MARHGLVWRHGVASGPGVARGHGSRGGPRCLCGTRAVTGRYGPAISRRMGYPAGAGRAHSRLIHRARRLSSGAPRPRPVLGPADPWSTGHRRRRRVMGRRAGVRIRDPGRLRASLRLFLPWRCPGNRTLRDWGPRGSPAAPCPRARRSSGPRVSLGRSSKPPGEYTLVGFRTRDRAERLPSPRPCRALPWSASDTLRRSRPRMNAATTRTTRPSAIPAAPTSNSTRPVPPPGALVTERVASTRITPSVTAAAPATDRTTTSRILLPVGVSERTAQPSHRGYRPASHMARCNHYGRYC